MSDVCEIKFEMFTQLLLSGGERAEPEGRTLSAESVTSDAGMLEDEE